MLIYKDKKDLTLGEIQEVCKSSSCDSCELYGCHICTYTTDTIMNRETPNWWNLKGKVKISYEKKVEEE